VPEAEEDAGNDVEVRAWTLRKSSASSLDVLSNCFPDELLPVMLPIVDVRALHVSAGCRPLMSPHQAHLRENDWRVREAAVLALGAVAEGCDNGLDSLAPQIIAGLLPTLDDPRPLVRSIACWTLGRYSRWLKDGGARSSQLLDQLLSGLLTRVLDRRARHSDHCVRRSSSQTSQKQVCSNFSV
jgi:transportin-1